MNVLQNNSYRMAPRRASRERQPAAQRLEAPSTHRARGRAAGTVERWCLSRSLSAQRLALSSQASAHARSSAVPLPHKRVIGATSSSQPGSDGVCPPWSQAA